MQTKLILTIITPLVLLIGMLYYLNNTFIDQTSLPHIAVEKVEFTRDDGIGEVNVYIRNIGPNTITIAQADINDKPIHAKVKPTNTLNRLESAHIIIHYPWIENIPYQIGITTSDGTRFTFDVKAAVLAPQVNTEQLLHFALIGSYVGIIPVVLGFFWLPYMRRIENKWYEFFLTLTAGLLVFLAIDAISESFTFTKKFTILNGEILIATIIITTFLLLMFVKINKPEKDALYLAYMIAIGIGLHNMGEGLAIGAATVIGATALSRFLIMGFAIHNTTEGLAIVAPLTKSKIRITHLAILGLIAGVPTIFGTWIGSLINMPMISVIFLSIGAGAILQVVYAIFAWFKERGYNITSMRSLSGFACGMLIMYITSILVA